MHLQVVLLMNAHEDMESHVEMVFGRLDTNKDGVITKEEFIENHGPTCDPEQKSTRTVSHLEDFFMRQLSNIP